MLMVEPYSLIRALTYSVLPSSWYRLINCETIDVVRLRASVCDGVCYDRF